MAQPSAAEPAAPSTPGRIDFGAGDEMPFLDGEPYSPGDSYAPSLAESPPQEHGEEPEEEEADPDRGLATVEDGDEHAEEAPPLPEPATPKAGPKAPPAAWLEAQAAQAAQAAPAAQALQAASAAQTEIAAQEGPIAVPDEEAAGPHDLEAAASEIDPMWEAILGIDETVEAESQSVGDGGPEWILLNLDQNLDQLNLRSPRMDHLAQEYTWHRVEQYTAEGTPVASYTVLPIPGSVQSTVGCPQGSRGIQAWAAVHLTVDCYHADPRCPRLRQAGYRRKACAECGGLNME